MPWPKEAKPDIEAKLNAPSKKSIFERQKAEAEAKRLKEQRETAAVYEDFVKSFDDGGSDDDFPPARRTIGRAAPAGPSNASKRHFSNLAGTSKGIKLSGPGSLGPPPSSLGRKRTHEGSPPKHSLRAFGEDDQPQTTRSAFKTSDDEDEDTKDRAEERAAQRPTIHMSSLPPGMSTAAIKAVIPATITVDNVRILPTSKILNERRFMSAILTLASETPASELDSVVNQLQNKYLGRGYYLSLSRHLSSAVLDANLPSGSQPALPFGARAVPPTPGHGFASTPLRGGRGGIAPPPSLMHGASGLIRGAPPVRVAVIPPSDLKQLKLIHKMIEMVTLHGPEFEALLMSRPTVQKEERWAWLWDPSSIGGIWYRWRLWEIMTERGRRDRNSQRRVDSSMRHLFDRSAPWVLEEPDLPFEYAVEINEFVSDPDYDSTEDEDSGDEGRQRLQQIRARSNPRGSMGVLPDTEGPSYLNPLRKAKLVHLLSRAPETSARLRRGDVARVTSFAIQNAGEGAEEVVDLLATNVLSPFTLRYNPRSAPNQAETMDTGAPEEPKQVGLEEADPASAKLVALYLISDILSSSSTSGVRHAWRYRQLFENALRQRRIFEHLGRLEKQLKWGRLRTEKWRRAVTAMLHLWEGWSVFTAAAQEEFVKVFNNPPQTAEEAAAAARVEKELKKAENSIGRWKTLKGLGEKKDEETDAPFETDLMDVDENVDGELMMEDEDEDLDGVPMEDEDDGYEEPYGESVGAQAKDGVETSGQDEPAGASKISTVPVAESADLTVSGRKGRPRAVDMFGDSDDDK